MKILHTADWHLGHKLKDKDRSEEHKVFLDWLTGLIDQEEIDVLVVAGDVFDTANPPGAARQAYYNFLAGLLRTNLDAAVIVAGNHDSPQMLAASAEILRHLKVYVVGAVKPDTTSKCVFPIFDRETGEVLAGFASVPYLRHQDLLQVSAEDAAETVSLRLKSGIKAFYDQAAEKLEALRLGEQTPLIATGHLFAQGGKVDESMRDIHVGNLGQVTADTFSPKFDYVALGHLHRPQTVGGEERIRYSGSPVPLSFSELNYTKQVLIVEFEEGRLKEVRAATPPLGRQLISFEGPLEKVIQSLKDFKPQFDEQEAWAQIFVRDEQYYPDLNDRIAEALKDLPLEPLIVRCEVVRKKEEAEAAETLSAADLEELDPSDVFAALCAEDGFDLAGRPEVKQLYDELVEEARPLIEERADAE